MSGNSHHPLCDSRRDTESGPYLPCTCEGAAMDDEFDRRLAASIEKADRLNAERLRGTSWFWPNVGLAALLVVGSLTAAWCLWQVVTAW